MKNTFFLILLLFTFFCIAQEKTINLPKIDSEIKFTRLTPVFNVRVYADNTIYFEDTEVNIEKLGDSIFLRKDEISNQLLMRLQIHLYADKNVKYALIDKIKTQLTRAKAYTLIYRTADYNDIFMGVFFYRLHQKFGALKYLEKEIEKNEIPTDSEGINLPKIETIFDPVEIQLKNKLYDLKFDEVETLLNEFNYSNVRLIGNHRVILDGKKISLKNTDQLKKFIQNKNILFVRTSKKLNYEDYLKNIFVFKNIYKNSEGSNPYFIEISSELQAELKKRKFKF